MPDSTIATKKDQRKENILPSLMHIQRIDILYNYKGQKLDNV